MSRFIAHAKKNTVDKYFDVVILAAGQGRRMKSKGSKSLFPVKNTTLLNYQISTIKNKMPHAEVTVVLGYEIDKIYKTLPRNIRVVENSKYDSTTSTRSMFLGIRACSSDNIMIVNGDIFFNDLILEICGDKNAVLVDKSGQIEDNKVGVVMNNGYVTQFSFGVEYKWGQAIYLCGESIDILHKFCLDTNSEVLVSDIFNNMINKGIRFVGVEPDNLFLTEINIYDDLLKVK